MEEEKIPKVIDLLDEDRPISNQKFVCISFLSPEKIIKQRDIFNFEHFVKQWDFKKSTEKYTAFISFIAYKYNLDFDTLSNDLTDFVKNEKDELGKSSILDDFKTYIENHDEKLEEKFNKEVKFQTSTRGLKVRGVYPTQEEAELRCKVLREIDPNHDVYVGPVGLWMPWHPEAYKTGRVEYLEKELNNLMHEKQKNENKAKIEFDKRVREAKEKAINDNKEKALQTGNILTQNIKSDGSLYNVDDTNQLTVEELKDQLFEGEDIIVGDTDHGYSRLTQNQKKDELESKQEEDDCESLNESCEDDQCCVPEQSSEDDQCCVPEQSSEDDQCCVPEQSSEDDQCCVPEQSSEDGECCVPEQSCEDGECCVLDQSIINENSAYIDVSSSNNKPKRYTADTWIETQNDRR